MAKKIRELTENHWPFLVVFLAVVFLGFLNYEPGTWLIGWDNLQVELNPQLNLSRAINTTWQEYQSLGLLGGMAHGSALIYNLFAHAFTSLLPPSLFRYTSTFGFLLIGSLGVYFLSRSTLLKKFDENTKSIAALFTSLFYLLNLGTLQIFYSPFETFSAFYAYLPWLIWSSAKYLKTPNRLNLSIFILTNILASLSFYTQTIFVVYLLCLFFILLNGLLKNKTSLRSSALLLLVTLLIHSYWLLPAGYFTLTSSDTTVDALQNQIATREVILRNQEYGHFADVPLLKGFWFDYADATPNRTPNPDSNTKFDLMMGPWVNHLNQTPIKIIGYSLFVLIGVGVIYSLKRRLSYSIGFTFIFLLSAFFLINLNFPIKNLYHLLQDSIPLLKQIFRSSFTKWIVPASLTYSLFFGVGVVFLLDLFSLLHFRLTSWITTFSLAFALILFASPSFQGHLIYPAMRQQIPSEYFELFDYMQTQDKNTRIANLPQPTLWGWQFYNWPDSPNGGYRGSGFLWYGIEQPLLDRAFDVWSPYSEQYYKEITEALYSEDQSRLTYLLHKYQIDWILIDSSIVLPGQESQKALWLPETTNLLDRIVSTSDLLEKNWERGSLTLYKANLTTQPGNFITTRPLPPQPIRLLKPNFNNVSFPIVETAEKNRSVILEDGFLDGKNCDAFNTKLFSKTETDTEVTYSAIDANSCDHFLFPELSHSSGYTFEIEHRNLEGSPFSLCIESYVSRHCLDYRYLSESTDWHTDRITVPPLNPSNFGYTLHLFNYSIGRQETKNAWRRITVTPTDPATPINPRRPETTILSSDKKTYSLYTVTADSPQNSSLLTLNQAYDKGWKAYLVDSETINKPTWQLYLQSSMLIPLPEAHHIETNDWANGWLLPEGESNLIIVYQPQLLQYLGFALTFLTPLFLIFNPKRNNRTT